MGRVSDMAIGLEEEARDELLCEIDHLKGGADEAERLLRGLMLRHDGYEHGCGPCICEWHNAARLFLESKS